MTLKLEENELAHRLEPLLDAPVYRAGLDEIANDEFLLAFFLMSVSQGEGLGEAAVAMIGQEEVASLIRDLKRQELEERGHKEMTRDVALELFPQYFVDGRYLYQDALEGHAYYVAVLEANRDRLKREGRYSRLNLYLTTTLAYEVMVMLLYRAVADRLAESKLPAEVRTRVGQTLERILAEEETHLGVLDQHRSLLLGSSQPLSPQAQALLDSLQALGDEDYISPTELALKQIVRMLSRCAAGDAYRRHIRSSADDRANQHA